MSVQTLALGRRPLLSGLLGASALAGLGTLSGVAVAAPVTRSFKILLNGEDDIGTHTIGVVRNGSRTEVEVAIDIQVKAAFLTLYSYQHRNREIWQDGRLQSIRTQTDDNGKEYTLAGRPVGDGFLVDGDAGRLTAAPDIIPTSYWNPEIIGRSQVLDTGRGRLFDIRWADRGIEQVSTVDGPVSARHWSLSGDMENVSLWYTEAGDLVDLEFQARGRQIAYRLQTRTGQPAEHG